MKKIWKDERAVSPVIAVILMVAITVVLAAVLYVMVSGMLSTTSTTPTAGLTLGSEGPAAGEARIDIVYSGKTVALTDVILQLWDNSANKQVSEILTTNPSSSVTCGSGLFNATFYDGGKADQLDGGDIIKIFNSDSGDSVKLIYDPTGGTMGEYPVK